MSNESELSSDTSNTTLLNMNDLNISMTSMEPVITLPPDGTGVNTSDMISVSRSNADWVPVSVNEIPLMSNTLSFALSSDNRPNIASISTNTRTIAPKPVVTTAVRPTIAGNISTDKTQPMIITTTTDSVVNSTISTNKFALNKVIPISSHIALVTSPDGTSMLAVPVSSLMAKSNVNIKPAIAPVSISPAALKAKSPIMTPLKILPLMSSTATSATLTVPTISYSKNVQTLITPTPLSITKGISIPTLNTEVAIISKTVPTSEEQTEIALTSQMTESESLCTETSVKSEDNLQSPPLPPPLLSQSTPISSIPIENSQSLSPPTLTPVTTNPTSNCNRNTSPTNDQQNESKVLKCSESDPNSITGIEEMDSVIKIMEWKDGVGVLPGSDLKFRIDEFGHLDMIVEGDPQTNDIEVKVEDNTALDTLVPQESDKLDSNNETKDSSESEPMLTCINCEQRGPAHTFIRQGRFCSKSCATLEATHLKLYTKRISESLVKTPEIDGKKIHKKSENIRQRKQAFECLEQNPLIFQEHENSNQTVDQELEGFEDTNEEVEDVETNAGNYIENSGNETNFSWRQYLKKTNSMAAPIQCFSQSQTFPSMKNNFKVGMKLEGVDPQHPSKFCVLTVSEVCGFRIRLHFDGYRELFDFWVNANHDFIFAAGFCDETNRKLEPPVGVSPEEFNWNTYLQQTKAIAAPKQLFSSLNSEPIVTPNGFRVGMKLEAVDRANTILVCVATIADIIGNWLLIHFDGWDDSYDYWVETTSPFIHCINWCRMKGRSLTPPNNYHRSSERFVWEDYLSETKAVSVSSRIFKTRTSNNFKVGMKLEVVDKRNPRLVRVCTISHRQSHSIKIHFDGWDEKYDYWVDDDCPDIHPANWCHKTNHPLQPPPPLVSTIKRDADSCPTPGCNGIGHIRGPKYLSHHSAVSCPYTDSRLDYELPDRIKPSEGVNDEIEDSRLSPSQCSSPSESNSFTSTQKCQKSLKMQQIMANNKSRKRKLDNNGQASRPDSPSTNSESAKHSRPSTPSSMANLSSLQHSIFAMRLSQQQQEAPVCWDRHSKTTLPGIDKTKSKDVLLWSPTKVSEFIDQIPGCESIGQLFQDQLIDGEAFLLLNQNDIVKILGLKLGPAIKIYNSILVIRDNAINEEV